MAGQLFDVASVFGTILKTPEQQRAEALDRNLGLFGAGLGGALADTITNLEVSGRAGLNQALSAINPNLDIRTPQQRFTEAINNINPEDPDAEAKYIEATRTFAPERLPELVGNLRRMRMEDAEEARRAAEAQRQADAATRLQQAHESQMQREALETSIGLLDFNDAVQAREGLQAQKDYILSTTYGRGMGAELDAMTPEQVRERFSQVQGIEGAQAEALRGTVKSLLGADSEILQHLDSLGQQQLQAMVSGILKGQINPNTQVIGDRENGYSLVISNQADPSSPSVVPLVQGTPDVDPPRNPRSLNNRIFDMLEERENRIDLAFRGEGEVVSPSGQEMNPNDLIRRTATNFYQKSTITEAELEQRVLDVVNVLKNMDKDDVTFDTITQTLERYFPQGGVRSANDVLAELGLE